MRILKLLIFIFLLFPAIVWGWGTITLSGSPFIEDSNGQESLYIKADNGYKSYSTYQLSAAVDNPSNITFYMYIDNTQTILPSDGDDVFVFGMGSVSPPTNTTGVVVSLKRQTGGDYQLIARSGSSSTYIDADMNEWIKVEIDYNRNTTSTITFVSSSYPTGISSNFTATDSPVQYYSFGAIGNYNADEDFGIFYDDIQGDFFETFNNAGYDLDTCGTSSPCWEETITEGGIVDEDSTLQYH